MNINNIPAIKSEVVKAQELIKGLTLNGPFVHFSSGIDFHLRHLQEKVGFFNSSISSGPNQAQLDEILYFQDLRENHKYILDDLSNILLILFRLNWIKTLTLTGNCPKTLWREFTGLDINLFLVEFRSIFDYITQIIINIDARRIR